MAVLGQFKRGKSTLLNALLGVPLLPTGITPVTAIPTYVHPAKARCCASNSTAAAPRFNRLTQSEFATVLQRYVAEAANAGNRAGRSVEVAVPSRAFSDQIILVDTPGVGSTFIHNSRTAEAALSDCDVGVFVLSPDPPITEVELEYLNVIRRFIPKLYFALNKIDLLSPAERDVAVSFLANVLSDKLGDGNEPCIFPLSAKAALSAKQDGRPAGARGERLDSA